MGVELIRYKARYSSASTISRLYMESTPITNNADSNWSVTDHAMTIMNTAICIGDLAGNGQTKMCIALLSRTSDVVIENQYSNDGGITWTRGSSFVYTYPYNNGSHTAYSGGGLAKFPNTDVIYSTNISDVIEVYSIGTAIPVFTNISDYMNYIQNPYINYRDAVIIGKPSDAFPIAVNVGVSTIDKTGQQILNYALQRGYNSAMLIPFGKSIDIDYYCILLCDAALSNNDIYLYLMALPQVSNSQFGIFMGANDNVRYLDHEIEVDSSGNFYQFNGGTVNMSKVTYGGKDYRCLTPNRLTPKPAFLTTLAYNHIYLNSNHDITPETYDWKSVVSVTGKDKTYKLTKYLNINNGDPVNNVSYVNNVDVSAKSKVNNMVSDVIVDDNKVTVNYTIPAGNYSYIKLVYKKGSIPASYTDGTAIDITQSSTSKVISRLSFPDTAVYWFAIFTDRSTSEPVSLDLRGYNPVPAEYQDYIDLINGDNDMLKYYLRDNWLAYLSEYEIATELNCQWIKTSKNYSYVNIRNNTYGRPGIGAWDHSWDRTQYVSTNKYDEYSGKYTAKVLSMEPIDVYINGSGDSYTLTTSTQVPVIILSSRVWDTVYGFTAYIKDGENVVRVSSFATSYPEIQAFTYTGTLENCFKYAAMNLRNVNIYVNGVLWSEKIS